MTQLNQLIAIEQGVKTVATNALTEAHHELAKEVVVSGLHREYKPRDEEGEKLPPEHTEVQLQVEQVIANLIAPIARYWDVTLTKDIANTTAKADVVIELPDKTTRTLIKDAPVTYLIWLEKRLVDLRTFIAKLPVLDPTERWEPSEAGGYQSLPTTTTRSTKVLKAFVKYEATVQHPAQVDTFPENIVVGDWTLIKFSGKIPGSRKADLTARVETLILAVKVAREGANSAQVSDAKAAATVLAYLFGPSTTPVVTPQTPTQ